MIQALMVVVYLAIALPLRWWFLASFRKSWPLTSGRQDSYASWFYAAVWPMALPVMLAYRAWSGR